MDLSFINERTFQTARRCHICNQYFQDNQKRVRDHCHLTGKFRGAAHNHCNLNYKNAAFIPVVFHNFTGYDSHFIITEIATNSEFEGKISVLAENKERYISFTKEVANSRISFRFIDSFRFMPTSLDKLAYYLPQLDIVQREFQKDNYTLEEINLLKRKGVFPYEYIENLDRLTETELPSIEKFHSQLTDSDIPTEEYKHAQNVWNIFGSIWKKIDLGMYSDLYLKTDVLLLADIFENFRSTCKNAYDLDPAHYYTTPGLTWDAMLKYTNMKLELLTDIDMVLFIQKGIRGGISQCCNRFSKANNKYMGEEFNKDEPNKFLMYYDVNNLYGWAMTQSLPFEGFKWVSNVDMSNFFNISDDSDVGYILEVDLEYPQELHDEHKDLPLCPEHTKPPGSKQKKLLTTLYDKERYVIHYRALKQALKYGLKLKKIYRALEFKQKQWLKPYVDLNTEKRKQAKNEFEKLFYKLMINAVYGKTMEDERKRKDVKLINQWGGRYGAEARIAQPNFHSSSIFHENLAAIQLSQTTISIKKPIYIGLCVLDLSKTLVYDFHYGYMKQRIGEKCKLLYTDTDSLIYEIQDVDMYEIMKVDIDKFDTSDYPADNQFGMPLANKKVLGVMKDECNAAIMREYIGLRSKLYSIEIINKDPLKKAKGVKKHTVKNTITHSDYRRCLNEMEIIKRTQCNIRSKLHQVLTEREEKTALSPHDDKRCIFYNNPDTLPWGHYKTLEIAEMKERVEQLRRKRYREEDEVIEQNSNMKRFRFEENNSRGQH
ncbi:uncharacterized protein LOC131663808 [Phymastichus coffea]|uniref:uncharacterized protein LOC131663808 n=1 Tax=Phymastichus coffea TaxID=108790 RepID=UPI00273A7596|nr:uncharacterized protein LOC131663808 [Phymastichus coffea]